MDSQSIKRVALAALAVMHFVMLAWLPSHDLAITVQPRVFYEALPVEARAVLWLLFGLMTLTGAIFHRCQMFAFVSAVIMPCERAVGHMFTVDHNISSLAPKGVEEGFGLVAIWFLVVILTLLIARIPEPEVAEQYRQMRQLEAEHDE